MDEQSEQHVTHFLRNPAIVLLTAAVVSLPAAVAAQSRAGSGGDAVPDRAALWIGTAPDTRSASIGLHWDLPWRGTLGRRGNWSMYIEGSLGHWRTEGSLSSVTQLGAMPTLRYSFSGSAGLFVEAGLGVNLITPLYEARRREFSTQFQFNESLGLGWRSQAARGWAVTLRYQHFSNSGIKKPNPGENFAQLHLSVDL